MTPFVNVRGVKILTASQPDQLEKLIADCIENHLLAHGFSPQSIQYQTALQGRQGDLRPLFTAMIVY